VTAIADKLGVGFALIHRERKRRAAEVVSQDNEEVMEVLVGNIEGKVAVLVDDMIDSGNTLTMAVQALSRKGARAIYALISHGRTFTLPLSDYTLMMHRLAL
jgi:ribose-phosphate pyrophosphokinase